jgi:hypothetical protein
VTKGGQLAGRRGIPPAGPGGHHWCVTDPTAKEPDLSAARAEVLAFVAGSPMAQNPPRVQATAPLGPLPPDLEVKLAARARELSTDQLASRLILPSAFLAVLDGVGFAIGLASGHYVLASIAGVLFVVLAAWTISAYRMAARHPHWFTGSDHRTMIAARQWRSSQSWTGALASCPERGLVIAATRAVERITRSVPWQSGQLNEQRTRLDLRVELDQVDEQAYQVAAARHDSAALGDPAAVDAAWEAALNRVAALTAYANRISGSDARHADLAKQGDPVRDENLLAGSARDELAVEELVALTYYLNANLDDRA